MRVFELLNEKVTGFIFQPSWIVGQIEGIFDGDGAFLVDLLVHALIHCDYSIFFIDFPELVSVVASEAEQNFVVVCSFFDTHILGVGLEHVVHWKLLDFSQLRSLVLEMRFIFGDDTIIKDGFGLLGLDEVVNEHKDHAVR